MRNSFLARLEQRLNSVIALLSAAFSVMSPVVAGVLARVRISPEALRDCEFTCDRKGPFGEGFRDSRSLCGALRRRPLDTVKLRMIVRVAKGRAFANLAHSAALFVGGPV